MLKTFQHPELDIFLPSEVKIIFSIFGDKIRLVGGCVRDLLLKKTPNDFDFATILQPQEIIKILENNNVKAVPTGLAFGTITAVINNKNFEITTLRKDIENDGRHAVVEFVDDYFFDSQRRDFTINALYLDFTGLVYDYFNGIDDLKNKKVKFIGDANARISEDFLRILRFFRFSCDYANNLDLEGLRACIKHKNEIKFLSKDRIRNEVFKVLLKSKNEAAIKFFQALDESKIAAEIFNTNLDIINFKRIISLEESLNIKLLASLKFFILICKKELNLKEIFYLFNFSNLEKKYFEFLFKNIFQYSSTLDIEDLKLLLVFEKKEFVADFYCLNSLYNYASPNLEYLEFIQNFILKDFPLKGEDLLALGFRGEKIAQAIKKAKLFWVEHDFAPNKSDLIDLLKQLQ